MEDLFLLINKNKKEIVSYFEGNNIKYKLEKNVFVYEIELFDEKFKVEIGLFHKIAITIRLSCTSLKSTNYERYLKMINNFKNYMNSIYGLPDADSTNHMSECLTISYSKDNSMVYIQGNNGLYNNNRYSFEIHIHSFNSKIKENMWPKILIYLGGGLFWGLMMFLFMSHGEYNWLNFIIWMSGGLFFAILFGVIFELVMNIENRDKFKPNHKHDKKFIEYEKNIEYTLSLNGILYPKNCPARLYFNGNNVTIAYYNNGLRFIKTDLKYIDDKMMNHWFSLDKGLGKKTYVFNLENTNDLIKIIEYINSRIYNDEKYTLIYNKIEKVIKEYNPYSLLNKNDNIFVYEIFIICKEIYNNPNYTLENIKDLIYESFDEDIDSVILSDLSELIIKSLN